MKLEGLKQLQQINQTSQASRVENVVPIVNKEISILEDKLGKLNLFKILAKWGGSDASPHEAHFHCNLYHDY